MFDEEYALRCSYPLYDEWCRDDEEDAYGEYEYDPYAEAEAIWESMNDR